MHGLNVALQTNPKCYLYFRSTFPFVSNNFTKVWKCELCKYSAQKNGTTSPENKSYNLWNCTKINESEALMALDGAQAKKVYNCNNEYICCKNYCLCVCVNGQCREWRESRKSRNSWNPFEYLLCRTEGRHTAQNTLRY